MDSSLLKTGFYFVARDAQKRIGALEKRWKVSHYFEISFNAFLIYWFLLHERASLIRLNS